MPSPRRIILTLAALVCAVALFGAAHPALAQETRVFIDGKPIALEAPVVIMQGQALVPLKSVVGGLRGTLKYDKKSNSYTATRGSQTVKVTVNSRKALVNGAAKILDVPVTTLAGKAMVPLKFVGEAFLVSVRTDRKERAIYIETAAAAAPATPSPTPSPTPAPPPVIQSVTHTAAGAMEPGSVIEVTLTGTPGGTAAFDIAGVASAVVMKEGAPGVYMGSYTVKASDKAQGAAVTGSLVKNGLAAAPVQATVAVAIAKPRREILIVSVSHEPVSPLKPGDTLRVRLIGSQGCTATFDLGDAVTGTAMTEAKPGEYIGSLTIPSSLEGSTLPVRGHLVQGDSTAPVITATTPVIISKPRQELAVFLVTHNGEKPLKPGDTLTVKLFGTPGASASFDMGDAVRGVPMAEVRQGEYAGSRVLTNADTGKEIAVTGHLVKDDVKAQPRQAEAKLTIAIPGEDAMITAISHNASKRIVPGEVLEVTLTGTKGGKATFAIGGAITALPMVEAPPGTYRGTYTARVSDKAENAVVTGTLKMENGTVQTASVPLPVTLGPEPEVRILSIAHNGATPLKPGDVLQAVLTGTPGGRASFDIGTAITGVAMEESPAGTYRGAYTVKAVDNVTNAPVTGRLTVNGTASQPFVAALPVTLGPAATPPVEVAIASFTHNAVKPVREGAELRATLVGTPGGKAVFAIGTYKTGLPMTEVRTGTYEGVYTVARGDRVVNAPVLGYLEKDGKGSPVVQAGTPVTLSGVLPKLSDYSPLNGSVVTSDKPNIYLAFDTQNAAAIDVQTVRLIVDGRDVSAETTKNPSFAAYYPTTPLPAKKTIVVQFSASDDAGNPVVLQWQFTVDAAKVTLLTSATHNGQAALKPGETLVVTATGRSGATAWFDIEGFRTAIPMAETGTGTYTGRYTVTTTDSVSGARVVVHLKAPEGEEALAAERTVKFELPAAPTTPLGAPTVTAPANSQQVPIPFKVEGYTRPSTTVEIIYDVTKPVFGIPVKIGATQKTVSSDDKGYFQDTFDRSFGGGAQYRIIVTAIDGAGARSPSTELTVTQQ